MTEGKYVMTGTDMACLLRALANRMERKEIDEVYFNLEYGTDEIAPVEDEDGKLWHALAYSGEDSGEIRFSYHTSSSNV